MTDTGRTVSVCAGSGGAGATVVATNLAISLAQQTGGRTLLVDAAIPLPGDAGRWLGLERVKPLADMAPFIGRLTPDSFATYVATAPSGIAILPFISQVLQARLITDELIGTMLHLARGAFSSIVVDLPPMASAAAGLLLDSSDAVCLVVDPSPVGVARSKSVVDFLQARQVPSSLIVGCVNGAAEGTVNMDAIERLVKVKLHADLPRDDQAMATGLARGTPLVVSSPRHAISRGIDRLAREVATRALRKRAASAPIASSALDPYGETIVQLKLKIHKRLVEEIDFKKADFAYLRDPIKLQEVRVRAEAKVMALVDEEAREIENRALRRKLVKDVLDEALGLGPLEDLLADPAVTEIMVNRHDQIYVEKHGKLTLTGVRFLNVEQLRGVIERIVGPLGRRIDEKVPMVDARLKDGSRVNAIIPPLALRGPAVTIRKFSKRMLDMEDLIRLGALSQQMSVFFKAAVRARLNIVISGGTGSGKTTLLNLLSSYVPDDERIITIEDAAELQLPQEHVVTLESRPANIEGEGAVTIRDLVKNALRMRPDRIVVGECRGGEALDMLQAMNTGHDGSLTTVHANSPPDAIARMETLALMSGLDLPARAIRDQISAAINLVVQQSRLQDGSRRITHVSEVAGQEAGEFILRDVFLYKQTGVGADGVVTGHFVPTGYVPEFIDRFARRGISVPREIFLPQTA